MSDGSYNPTYAVKKVKRDANRSPSQRWEGTPEDVLENARENAEKERISRMWKRPHSLTRAAKLWESAFGVIDLRALHLISVWTAYQEIMECVPPEKLIAYPAFTRIVRQIMIPLGHAYAVRHVELSRMDIISLTPDTYSRAVYYVVNAQCLPLYVYYLHNRITDSGRWTRKSHTIETFMEIIVQATPQEIDEIFSVRFDHMWLGKFPKSFTDYTWTWNGRVWDGQGRPRDVTLKTVKPFTPRIAYEEDFIRERHEYLDGKFKKGESNESE